MPTMRMPIPLLLAALVAGCATYAPLPLEKGEGLKAGVGQLDAGGKSLPARLSPDDIGWLALHNNPDLKAARNQRGVTQAQLLAAGIPPNPVISGSYGFLLGGPGTAAAVSAGLSQDVKALVTLSAKRSVARSAAQEVDASLLWQEWQTVGKARLLGVDLIEGERQLKFLQDNSNLLADRLRRSQAALAQGDASLNTVAPELAAAADARRALDDAQRKQESQYRELDALLGLQPQVRPALVETIEPAPVDPAAVRRLLPDLAGRRPDLIALQLGYRSQEAKLRAAVLTQFPTLSIGPAYASDTSNVRTLGPQLSFELPLFDRNQGNIAIERATRQQLHAEFDNRLAAARSEVLGLLSELSLLQGQLAAQKPQLAQAEMAAARAADAYQAKDLDERGYLDLLAARNTRRQDVLGLEQALLEQQVAIATLTGASMPPVSLPPEKTP